VWFGAMNERRIVGKYRVPDFGCDLELAYRDRVSRATQADGELRKESACAINGLKSAVRLEEDDRSRPAGFGVRRDVRHYKIDARFNRFPRIQVAQKLRARVESFCDS